MNSKIKSLLSPRLCVSAVILLCGCAVVPPSPNSGTVVSPEIMSHARPVAAPEPPDMNTNGYFFRFTFPCPLTNCYLQSSTDLVHWENRYDFTLETNTDGTIGWRVHQNPSKPQEFYLIGGETF